METVFTNLPQGDTRIVYVRRVAVADLPDDIRADVAAQADGIETLYALHRPDGARLALVGNRELAFALARQHDFAPVNVH